MTDKLRGTMHQYKSWDNLTEDPHGCINIGDMIDNGLTEVIGFSAPAGDDPMHLMVKIKYQNGATTARNYAWVLVQKVKGQIQSNDTQQDAQAVPLPEHETEAMHEAVMAVVYQSVTRTNTDALWQAYRSAMLNAAPASSEQRVMLTDEDVIDAYERKNGVKP